MTQTPDYLLIGTVTRDETPAGPKLGGTVSYAGNAALALNAKVAAVTSARKDEVVLNELPAALTVHLVEAPHSTIYVNEYVGDTRRQVMRSRCATLTYADVPETWRQAPIVHFAPLADEIDISMVSQFPASLVAATPQGWMRAWDAEGVVSPKKWDYAETLLPVLNATVFSEDDIGRNAALEAYYASLAQLLIVTRAAKGCTVYQRGQDTLHIPAPQVPVVDATGAGDIFAAIYLIMYQRTQDVRRAATIAVELASISVTRPALTGIATPQEVEDVLRRV